MMKRMPQITPTTMAAMLGPEWALPVEPEEVLLPLEEEPPPELGDAVSVTVLPPGPVMVYVMGFPVASGPAVAVTTGAVTVAPPEELPPTMSMTAWGTT